MVYLAASSQVKLKYFCVLGTLLKNLLSIYLIKTFEFEDPSEILVCPLKEERWPGPQVEREAARRVRGLLLPLLLPSSTSSLLPDVPHLPPALQDLHGDGLLLAVRVQLLRFKGGGASLEKNS